MTDQTTPVLELGVPIVLAFSHQRIADMISTAVDSPILMATKDNGAYARHFGDFLGENEDANTADLFMQFAVYGEEVFA